MCEHDPFCLSSTLLCSSLSSGWDLLWARPSPESNTVMAYLVQMNIRQQNLMPQMKGPGIIYNWLTDYEICHFKLHPTFQARIGPKTKKELFATMPWDEGNDLECGGSHSKIDGLDSGVIDSQSGSREGRRIGWAIPILSSAAGYSTLGDC